MTLIAVFAAIPLPIINDFPPAGWASKIEALPIKVLRIREHPTYIAMNVGVEGLSTLHLLIILAMGFELGEE